MSPRRAIVRLTDAWVAAQGGSNLTALVRAVVALGALVLAAALAGAIATGQAPDRWVLLVAAATLCTDATCVDLRVGRHVESYTWAELNLVLGLALLPPSHLVLTSLCLAVAYAATRRSTVKILYNTASYAIGVALATFATGAVADPSWDRPLRSALAIVAGVATFSWWNTISVDAAIAFSQDLPFRRVYRKGRGLHLAVWAGNVVTGLGILALAHVQPWALLSLPACLLAAYTGYRAYLRTIQERLVWQHLEATSQEINRLDEREVAEVALSRAAALLEADEVELCIHAREEGARSQVYVGTAAGVARVTRALPHHPEDRFAVLHYRAMADRSGAGDEETCVVAPLQGRERQIGVLRIHFRAKVRLSDRERQLLRTYAHTVSTNVENARLFAEMAEQAARSEQAALHDPLTGLPNRSLLAERARELFELDGGTDSFAVMLIDLDRFKEVNDTRGHAAGDALLREVASRLRRSVRPQDTVCRLGGDEFAILLADGSAADRTAERLVRLLAEPVEIDGAPLAVGGSIGIACHPQDGTSFEDLLKRADAAMYQAKATRGSFRRSGLDHDGFGDDRLRLISELRAALERDELEVEFQPDVDLAAGERVRSEAIVRWRQPASGVPSGTGG